MAMRSYKEKKATESAKEILEDKIAGMKYKLLNEQKWAKVAQKKALIEAEQERKQRDLAEKEKREMSPIMRSMHRTFNASASAKGFFQRHTSLPQTDYIKINSDVHRGQLLTPSSMTNYGSQKKIDFNSERKAEMAGTAYS